MVESAFREAVGKVFANCNELIRKEDYQKNLSITLGASVF